jgi:hypothetical protein
MGLSSPRAVRFRVGAGAPRWGGLDAQSRSADVALDSGSVRIKCTAPSTTRDQRRFFSNECTAPSTTRDQRHFCCPVLSRRRQTDSLLGSFRSPVERAPHRGRDRRVTPTLWGVDRRGVGNRGCRASSQWPRYARDAIGGAFRRLRVRTPAAARRGCCGVRVGGAEPRATPRGGARTFPRAHPIHPKRWID